MTYDPLRQRVVLFGGNVIPPVSPLGDTWENDRTSWTQRVLTTSPSRIVGLGGVDGARLAADSEGARSAREPVLHPAVAA